MTKSFEIEFLASLSVCSECCSWSKAQVSLNADRSHAADDLPLASLKVASFSLNISVLVVSGRLQKLCALSQQLPCAVRGCVCKGQKADSPGGAASRRQDGLYSTEESNMQKDGPAQLLWFPGYWCSPSKRESSLSDAVPWRASWPPTAACLHCLDLPRALLQALSPYRASTLGINSTQVYLVFSTPPGDFSMQRQCVPASWNRFMASLCPGAVHRYCFDSQHQL